MIPGIYLYEGYCILLVFIIIYVLEMFQLLTVSDIGLQSYIYIVINDIIIINKRVHDIALKC